MAERLGARHAVAVVSPMAGFHLAYRGAGLPVGATILATSFADPTVVRAAVASGQRLAFADVDERGHLSPDALREHTALRGVPSLIVASHLAGHACETAPFGEVAPGALVIEDAVDALGAATADERPVGSPRHAAMTVVGIHPVRAGAPAQGAVLLTDDVALAARCRRFRDERVEHRLPSCMPHWRSSSSAGSRARSSCAHASLRSTTPRSPRSRSSRPSRPPRTRAPRGRRISCVRPHGSAATCTRISAHTGSARAGWPCCCTATRTTAATPTCSRPSCRRRSGSPPSCW
jgi:dTDP-4-amino-4,6-dideoxygalactose transaminase